MLFRRFRVLGILAFAVSLAAPTFARKPDTGFLDRTVTVDGATYKYQVFLPEDWSRKQKWPVILFLHGTEQRGSDGLLQTEVGLPSAVRRDRFRFPAVIVIPQCKTDLWWTEPSMQAYVLASLAAATREFKGDLSRTYLTGLSMGGSGSWSLAEKYPGKFAAVVPICGGIVLPKRVLEKYPERAKTFHPDDPKSYAEVAAKIGKTPVWIFHGGEDPVVPVEGARKMNEALKAAGGNVRYTEYQGVGHDAWDRAYAEPELMTWLLSKSL